MDDPTYELDPELADLDRRIRDRFGDVRWPEKATCDELAKELVVFAGYFESDQASVNAFWDAMLSFARAPVFTVEEAERGLHCIYRALRRGAAMIFFELALQIEVLSNVGPRILRFAANLPGTLEDLDSHDRAQALSRWESFLSEPAADLADLDFDEFLETLAKTEPPPKKEKPAAGEGFPE
jgi:hypothetical protein